MQAEPRATKPPEQPRQLTVLLHEMQELSRVAQAIQKKLFLIKKTSQQVQIPEFTYVAEGHSVTQDGPRANNPPEQAVQERLLLQYKHESSNVLQAIDKIMIS